jgi:6-phosphogluconolactonase
MSAGDRSAPQPPHDADVIVAKDREEHAAIAAELLGRAIKAAVQERNVARVALSGGGTPSETYQRLAAMALPFDRVEWFWVDERGVPPDHPRSNYREAAIDLSLADGKHGRAHRMTGERDLDQASADYEALLRRTFGVAAAVAFDAMLLGEGDDGHLASLFPGIGAVHIDDRLVAHIKPPAEKRLEERITLTTAVILEAKLSVMLVRGASKRAVVAAARAPGSEDEVPSRILQRAKGTVVWVLDRDAAGHDGPTGA